jgi:DNA-binding transcriptional ArsR family regulator
MADHELVLDRLVHEPGRLAILTVLSSVTDADFLFLQRTTGLTKGNLSSHLAKLEEGGLVTIDKRFVRKKPNTRLALTADGKDRVARHWDQLERLRQLGAG